MSQGEPRDQPTSSHGLALTLAFLAVALFIRLESKLVRIEQPAPLLRSIQFA